MKELRLAFEVCVVMLVAALAWSLDAAHTKRDAYKSAYESRLYNEYVEKACGIQNASDHKLTSTNKTCMVRVREMARKDVEEAAKK